MNEKHSDQIVHSFMKGRFLGKPANDKIYTRRWVVDLCLDLVGYQGENILDKCIVEPSCGEGSFVLAIAERLLGEFDDSPNDDWASLSMRMRAYDTDIEALTKTRCLLEDKLTAYGCPVDEQKALLDAWLVHEDFLLSSGINSCDFVVGNPPYMRCEEICRSRREEYIEKLTSFTAGCDIYVGFYDKGLNLLRDNGALCFICADRWLQNAYGKKLRGRIADEYDLTTLIRMHGVDAFVEEVDCYPAITLIQRCKHSNSTFTYIECSPAFGTNDLDELRSTLVRGNGTCSNFSAASISKPSGSNEFLLSSPSITNNLATLMDQYPSATEAGIEIGIGMATGCDRVFLTDNPNLVEPSRLLPIFFMRDYRKGTGSGSKWLVNPWDSNGKLVDLASYPKLAAYYESNRDALERRYVARHSPECWYRTVDKPRQELIGKDLLLLPDMAAEANPVITHGQYPHHNCYWLHSDCWDLRALGGLLMSDIIKQFVAAICVKMRGDTLRFQAQYLRKLPIPEFNSLSEETKEGLAESFVNGNRDNANFFTLQAYSNNGRQQCAMT